MTGPAPTRKIAIPRLLQVGRGCLDEFTDLLAGHGFDAGRVLVGCGEGPAVALANRVADGLRAGGLEVLQRHELRGTLEQAAATAAAIIEEDVTLAVAVGGGRAIDTVKLAAARSRTEFISVPTAISHDGISSPVAALIGRDGRRGSLPAAMPAGIVVDLEVIAAAPRRTLRAGVGDLLSNLTALLDWRLADRERSERFDAYPALIAEGAARPALELDGLESPEAHEVVAKGLLLSGLAMAAAGTSRPCSGAEHLLSHSLDELLGERAAMHGEQVALGSLVSAAAHGSPLLGVLRERYAVLGLPRSPADLGFDDDCVLEALAAASATRPDRYTILSRIGDDRNALRDLMARAFAPGPPP